MIRLGSLLLSQRVLLPCLIHHHRVARWKDGSASLLAITLLLKGNSHLFIIFQSFVLCELFVSCLLHLPSCILSMCWNISEYNCSKNVSYCMLGENVAEQSKECMCVRGGASE